MTDQVNKTPETKPAINGNTNQAEKDKATPITSGAPKSPEAVVEPVTAPEVEKERKQA